MRRELGLYGRMWSVVLSGKTAGSLSLADLYLKGTLKRYLYITGLFSMFVLSMGVLRSVGNFTGLFSINTEYVEQYPAIMYATATAQYWFTTHMVISEDVRELEEIA